MMVLRTQMHVTGLHAKEITDFLSSPTSGEYQRWWPGVHLDLRVLKRSEQGAGSIVYMDEFIGDRRVKMTGVVTKLRTGEEIEWQLKQIVRLPVWLSVELKDGEEGVSIIHTIRVGFGGLCGVFDPIMRWYFSDIFAKAMDDHVRAEFPRLRDMLHSRTARS